MKLAIVALSLVALAMVVSAANGPADGPRVCIKHKDSGRQFPIHVDLTKSVKEVKETIVLLANSKIDFSQLELKSKGETLENDQTLEHYNIGGHSQLELVYSGGQPFDQIELWAVQSPQTEEPNLTVYMSGPDIVEFGVDVSLDDTVGTLKRKIAGQEEIPVAGQILAFGLPLDDHQPLQYYRFFHGASIYLQGNVTWCKSPNHMKPFYPANPVL